MPVSHIGLTVSHLPTSCSFFLSALQPLGYRFIGQQGNQIGLGINDADFFLCQETPGIKAGAAHIAFSAPSRTAVRDFYASALNAGGRPHGSPATRNDETGYFNAAVLDFDGNSIEVVYRDGPDADDAGTVIEHSRVLTWRKSVVDSVHDDRSIVSASSTRNSAKKALVPASVAPSAKAQSVISKAASMARSSSAPVSVPQISSSTSTGDDTAKKIIGTLLGAAAGAAVAYAMCKSEEDSRHAEAEFNAFQQSRSAPAMQSKAAEPKLSIQDPQPIYESPPRSIHRNISDTDSFYSTPQRRAYTQRAIEAAPAMSYHAPTYTSVPPTQAPETHAIDYIAASAAPPRSHFSTHRSVSSPSAIQRADARSSAGHSTLISSFHASEAPRALLDTSDRRSSAGSSHSRRSTKSKAKSSYTHVSKHSSNRKPTSRAPSPPPTGSKTASIVGSILGREVTKTPEPAGLSTESDTDRDTVAPSDSISNAGSSRRSHRSHRSSSGKSSHSKHSSSSSTSSKHSHSKKSYHSHSSRQGDDDAIVEIVRPTTVSEPSDTSTVKPYRRKDSGVGGMGMGTRTTVSLPVRGITPSMIEGGSVAGKGRRRSVVSYAMGQ
ncbi:hypothetical protein K432DRAFT_319421 [Lepidopterella palustris CBS 459.81]|uniref:VOC domain-containing protein n=1 Tax=Lepidopterella palustris CBS 459.81 TaxID=1314670 RepID=A0A8E2EJ12_9PEZI|nr:hypothetical protein K432DRAFT_319421 [Lepidopterella palustris CBS 459.81]